MSFRRIVVFGGNGYVGSALVRELVQRGEEVIVGDLNDTRKIAGAEYQCVDIRDAARVKAIIPEGAIVANFAGIADLNLAKSMPFECLDINVIGNCNILKACVEKSASKFCLASSAYVYSMHGSFYRITKRTCEEYAVEFRRKYGLPFLILRYGSLYGGDSNEANGMYRLVMSALRHGRLCYDGHRNDSREFIHVADASCLTADLLLGTETNEAYLLTGTDRLTMEQLFAMISEILNQKISFEFKEMDDSDHYRMTQYNFVPINARRLTGNKHIDIGSGLIDLIDRIYVEEKFCSER